MTDVQNSLQALKIFGITAAGNRSSREAGSAYSTGTGRTLADRRGGGAEIGFARQVHPGGPTVCFMISDVSTVWVQGHVFDRDLPFVKVGDPVDGNQPGFPTQSSTGRCNTSEPLWIPTTRTTPVSIVTQNPDGLLKKDLFVDAEIQTGVRKNILVVPVSAVLHDAKTSPSSTWQVQPNKFAQRLVTVGAQQGDQVEITSGIKAGESVVSQGSLFVQFALSAK